MKKIEEKAKEYSINVATSGSFTTEQCQKMAKDDFIAGYKAAHEWTKVEDELPEESMPIMYDGNYKWTVDPVLVKTSNGKYSITKRMEFLDHGWSWNGAKSFSDSVVEWRKIIE